LNATSLWHAFGSFENLKRILHSKRSNFES
jgi:hypothetical protein